MAITKSGVITSTGIPNPNLLPHTDILNYGLGYMTTYSSGTIMLDNTELFNGKPTIKINPSSSSTSSGGCNYYNSSVYLTSGKTYTYSCWIKSTNEDTWHHTSLGHFQTYTSSAAHNMTNGTALLSAVPANKWTYVAYSFQPTANCQFRSYFIYFANTSQTIWISDVKLEESFKPTAWVPNVNDTVSISQHGFIENNDISNASLQKNGYWNCKEIIEL